MLVVGDEKAALGFESEDETFVGSLELVSAHLSGEIEFRLWTRGYGSAECLVVVESETMMQIHSIEPETPWPLGPHRFQRPDPDAVDARFSRLKARVERAMQR